MVLLQTSVPRIAPFKACRASSIAPSHFKQRRHRHTICAAISPRDVDESAPSHLAKACRLAVAGVLASGLLWLSPSPAEADMQMVSPQMVTQMARPLPKQTVDKGKIWTVFIGGAVLLFGITVVAENNEQFFPAISRANKAFRMTSKQMDEMEERQKKEEELLRLRQAQYDEEQRQLALVQQGMKEARAKVLGAGAGAQQAPAAAEPTAPAEPAAPAAPVAQAAPVAHAAESHSEPAAQASTSASSTPYVVVQDAVPDMGAVAWPAGAGAGAATAASQAAASTSAHAEEAPAAGADGQLGSSLPAAGAAGAPVTAEEEAEAAARLARLQGFVSGTMAGGKSPLEAYKAQQRQ